MSLFSSDPDKFTETDWQMEQNARKADWPLLHGDGEKQMSHATRQEVLIRSLMEGLCLVLEKHYGGQTRQRPKLLAIAGVLQDLKALWTAYPIELSRKEAGRVQVVIEKFDGQHQGDPDWGTPEVVISMIMALGDHLYQHLQGQKKAVVGHINMKIMELYSTFDRKGAKLTLMEKGARLADEILAQEI